MLYHETRRCYHSQFYRFVVTGLFHDTPNEFFDLLHGMGQGHSTLARLGRNRTFRTKIDVEARKQLRRTALNCPDLALSLSRFCGPSAVLCFCETHAIWVEIDTFKSSTSRDEIPHHVGWETRELGLGNVTSTVFDGRYLTFIWLVDQPFTPKDYCEWFWIESEICRRLEELGATERTADIAHHARLVGTMNSSTNTTVRIENFGQALSTRRNIRELQQNRAPSSLYIHGKVLHLLQQLLHVRWFGRSALSSRVVKNWFYLMGLSLTSLVPESTAKQELRLLAQSIAGERVVELPIDECIFEIGQNKRTKLGAPDEFEPWWNHTKCSLDVSEDEEKVLLKRVASTEHYNSFSVKFHELEEFTPLNRLLLSAA